MQHNPLDFDGMLDSVAAGEENLPDSIAVAIMDDKPQDGQNQSGTGKCQSLPLCYPRSPKTFNITLVKKDCSSRVTTIKTDGNVPEVIIFEGIFFKLNLGLGTPYLYLQIYGENLHDIEVEDSPTDMPSSSLVA